MMLSTTTLPKLMRKADRITSEYVLIKTRIDFGPMCPLCRMRPVQECFHFFPRGCKLTRWDEDNCVGSCGECNKEEKRVRNTPAADKYRRWFIHYRGEGLWLQIEERAAAMWKPSRDEVLGLIADIGKKLQRVRLNTVL